MLKYCSTCARKVLPSDDDACPACGVDLSEASDQPSGEEAAEAVATKVEASGKPRGVGVWLRKKALTLIVLGVVFALLGSFGGGYERRGAGYTASGGELTTVGLVILGIGAVLYGVTFLGGKSRT